jgi:hypothetical protein
MPLCANCEKHVGKPKSCAKCRSVAYCSADCQKVDWETHKNICKPCPLYVLDKVMALDASNEWRKLLTWKGYLEQMCMSTREAPHRVGDSEYAKEKAVVEILRYFIRAYKMGIRTTNDITNIYASAAIPLLEGVIEIQGNIHRFADQGASICDLAEMVYCDSNRDDNEATAYYKRACVLGAMHNLTSVECRACLGLGRMAKAQMKYEDAAAFLRLAVKTAVLVNKGHEMNCNCELIDVLLELNAIDEAEPLITRSATLRVEVMRPSLNWLHPQHVVHHLHLARVHEARGKTEKVEREVRALITLFHENKASIHDWRPTFLKILEDASKHLTVLHPETGNKILVKSMADLEHMHRMPRRGMYNGGEWREIVQR